MTIAERFKKTIEWAIENGISTEQVPKEIAAERLSICKKCEHYIKPTAQCGICLCFLKIKTRLVVDPVESAKKFEEVKVKCPVNKWREFDKNSIINQST